MNKCAWHNLFYSPNEPHLRAGWQLIIQLAMMFGIMGFLILTFAFINTSFHWKLISTNLLILSTLIQLISFTLSTYIAQRFLAHHPFLDLGLRSYEDFGIDIFTGIVLPGFIFGIVYVAMKHLGWLYTVEQTLQIDIGQVGLYCLIFIIVGFQEELLCRGYILQTITNGSNVYWGMLGSSLIFAMMHLGNPGANWMALVGIFFAGMFLAFAAMRTGHLWLSIGLHIGWNFFEGLVWGFPASGVAIYSPSPVHITGPVLWTGGAFGPEAGLIILPALAIGAMLVWAYTR